MERYLRATGEAFPAVLHRDRGRPGVHASGPRAATSRAGSSRIRPPARSPFTSPHPTRSSSTSSRCRSRTSCPPARPRAGRRTSHRPAPGPTGSRRGTPQGGRLVRNPHFRPTANRPAGLADRIEFKASHAREGGTRGIAAVERGSADVVFLSPPLPRARSHAASRRSSLRAPGQVHSIPTAGTTWMFLNVRRPPFDDIRVRRAINLATDRAALVELRRRSRDREPGLPDRPDRVPGLRARLPLHRRPVTRPRVDRARLERARRLIAASGTAGGDVVVDVPTPQRPLLGRYFVSLLRELGFRARLRVIPFEQYFTRINARARAIRWASWLGRGLPQRRRRSSNGTSAARRPSDPARQRLAPVRPAA